MDAERMSNFFFLKNETTIKALGPNSERLSVAIVTRCAPFSLAPAILNAVRSLSLPPRIRHAARDELDPLRKRDVLWLESRTG